MIQRLSSSIRLNNSVLSSFLKTGRLMPGLRRCLGREFQALGQATMKARGPIVNVWHAGTRISPEAAERRCDRPVTPATGVHSMARYRGAESFKQRKARRDILNSIRDLMSSQCNCSRIESLIWSERWRLKIKRAAPRTTPSSRLRRSAGAPVRIPLQ